MTTKSLISDPPPGHSHSFTAAFWPALAICALALSAGTGMAAEAPALAETNAVKVYTVNRKVADFPDKEDMSTPEAAYATLNRLSATGDQAFWRRLSGPRLAQRIEAQPGKREVSAEKAAECLGAKILEVHLWRQTNAMVIAQMPRDIDLRYLSWVDGKWLNDGNDRAPNLDEARDHEAEGRAFRDAEPLRQEARRLRRSRPPVADPEKHLRPFVEFLQRQAAGPQEYVLQALAKHRVVILGEVHHRQRYWVFNAALVRSPRFAQHVGVIYLELPSNDQSLIDQFLAAPKYDPAPVIDVLRDMFEFGWPDQATVEFCQAVWEVNQALPKEQRIRIVLVDMARPWRQIQKRGDWTKYDVDRNELMAKQIERDQREHAQDARHAMFIVGYGHAPKNLTYPGGVPFKSAGWHLCRGLGDTNVFAVFPHSAVMANVGGVVDGRLALGLFETAFAALSNRPMAFPLDHGPFGELLFDASSDLTTTDSYRAGFDAFLYLGPLEDEIMSPLVPGFYTDEYAREIDRRLRVMDGHGLDNEPEIGQVSGEAIRRQSEKSWGQPWYERRSLGPLDAWHYGSNWKQQLLQAKYREALKDSMMFRREAEPLLTILLQTDYTQDWEILNPLLSRLNYCVETDRPGWVRWMVQHFRTNPIVQVELGAVSRHSSGCPAVPYKLVLKDRTTLEGALPFELDLQSDTWQAVGGLDWHLGKGKPQSSAGQPVTPEKTDDTKGKAER